MTLRTLQRLLLIACFALLIALPASASKKTLFEIADPRGDDHGDGRMVYPLRTEFAEGDLDIVNFKARRAKGATEFEVTFANPVKIADRRAMDEIGTSLASVARNGFYTFNVDIYIDIDRKPESGWVGTLPGRLAEIDPDHAWERAVVLTPRPIQARNALKRMMIKTLDKELREGAYEAEELAQHRDEMRRTLPSNLSRQVHFPQRVRARGHKVTFKVPDEFLGSPASGNWSYVVVVSGADLVQSLDMSAKIGLTESTQDNLMVVPVSPGTWQHRFGGGREREALQPPLVDILVPSGVRQERVLSTFSSADGRPVKLVGVVPLDELDKDRSADATAGR